MANQNERAVDYATLGLEPNSPTEAVRQRYLKLINTWNPGAVDREASPELFEMTQARHDEINAAYQRLADALTPAPSEDNVTVQPPNETYLQVEEPGADSTLIEPPDLSPTALELPAEDADEAIAQSAEEQEEDQVISRSFGRGEDAPSNNPAAIFSLLRWDKPAGRLILMIPALWAAFLAATPKQPSWQILLIIILGSIATSAVGCAVNDLSDQDIDAQVERTQNRPLAAGTMSREMAIWVAIAAGAVSVVLAFLLNRFALFLCIPAAIVILLYPKMKRVIPVPQIVLALAWGFAVLISWAAVAGTLAPAAWILWLATVLWTLGFDTVYAMADREDDARIGIKSSALFFGERSPQAVGLFFIGTALMLLWLGTSLGLGIWYWISLCIVTLGWLSHFRKLDNHRLRSTSRIYGLIFNQNVWLGLLILFGIVFGRGAV